nr:CBN-HEX-2 protein [Haemonchus contortus]
MSLHSKIRMSSIHIGADEVFQMGQCDADREVLPVKYGNSTKRLVFDYIRTIATNITSTFPKTKVLMWFDELKYVERPLIKEYGLDRLVTPVVWKYTADLEKDLPAKMWEELAASFSTVWGGSAFKGADGPNRYWNRMKSYVQNNRQWYLQAEQYDELFSDFHGFILTGWQRYDHFASLCELMPVSMASLAINLKIVRNYAVTDSDGEQILRILKCPSETTIGQVIFGEDKCHFAGYKVRDSIRDFMMVKQQYENASWVHNREAAYLQRSQIRLNASNPFYVDAIGRSYQKSITRLDKIMDQLKSSMNDIFFKDVFVEFSTDYILPFYDELKQRLNSVAAIDAQRTYRARPWFRR